MVKKGLNAIANNPQLLSNILGEIDSNSSAHQISDQLQKPTNMLLNKFNHKVVQRAGTFRSPKSPSAEKNY